MQDEVKNRLETIILKTLQELNEELQSEALNSPDVTTRLYGGSGVLDSLSLVLFVTDLEEKISDEFDKEIVLADEKAMSQRTSPFRNVESLTSYVENLLKEA